MSVQDIKNRVAKETVTKFMVDVAWIVINWPDNLTQSLSFILSKATNRLIVAIEKKILPKPLQQRDTA